MRLLLHSQLPRKPPKTRTGIGGFDEITLGGLPSGRPTLVCGGPGSGKTLLALTFLVNGATTFDEPGVLLTFEENAEEMASDVASLGFNLPELIEAKKLASMPYWCAGCRTRRWWRPNHLAPHA